MEEQIELKIDKLFCNIYYTKELKENLENFNGYLEENFKAMFKAKVAYYSLGTKEIHIPIKLTLFEAIKSIFKPLYKEFTIECKDLWVEKIKLPESMLRVYICNPEHGWVYEK